MSKSKINKTPLIDPYSHCRREKITERFVAAMDYIILCKIRGTEMDRTIADNLQIARQTLSMHRAGRQDVTIEHVAFLCDYYGVSESYILRGKGAPGDNINPDRVDDLEKRVSALEKKLK